MTPTVDPRVRRWRVLSFSLFAALSLATFAGPLAVFVVGAGGERPAWPPDRPIEWRVLTYVTVGYVVLLILTLVASVRLLKLLPRPKGRGDIGSR